MVDPEMRFVWESLTANEQRVLAAWAAGFTPYQREAQLLLGLAIRSSAARAVDGLDSRAVVVLRSTHPTLEAAQGEAEILAGRGPGADLMIFDTDDPNDLPDWAVGVR